MADQEFIDLIQETLDAAIKISFKVGYMEGLQVRAKSNDQRCSSNEIDEVFARCKSKLDKTIGAL